MWKHRCPVKRGRGTAALVAVVLLAACSDESLIISGVGDDESCSLDPNLLASVLGPDAIPAITEPKMVDATSALADYLRDDDRVLGLVIEGEARAYPHNILWWHEIINDRIGDTWVSVSFCPLTGSGLAFNPQLPEGRLDLGVSGLLFANNLVLYDRVSTDIYGPQLSVDGKCGRFRRVSLKLQPIQEMSWGRWRGLHPDTEVVGSDQGFSRDYQLYPYGSYDRLDHGGLLFPMDVDASRAIKERVLAIRDGDAGRGYPFGELGALGSVVAVNELAAGQPTVIFYEERDGETALAYYAWAGGQALTFTADPNGSWTDQETGSTWNIGGMATAGPLAGEQLTIRADAYVVFWFAWRHFQPNASVYPTIAPEG